VDSIFDAAEGGERGESGDLWDEPDQTVENVKRVRHEQSEEAVSAHLGAGIQRRARPRAGGRAAAVHSCQPLCRDRGQVPVRPPEGSRRAAVAPWQTQTS